MALLAEDKKNKFIIYCVKEYKKANLKFIKDNGLIYESIKKIGKELSNDNFYHTRIIKNNKYVFFGDLDGCPNTISSFKKILKKFLLENYGLKFTNEEFKYTKNSSKKGSYHYSIPKWHCSTNKLREIHSNLIKQYQKEFTKKGDKATLNFIDTTIYSNHWFRYPNQSKGVEKGGIHKIKKGNMCDFILDYIPENSKNIEMVKIKQKEIIKKENEKKTKKVKNKELEIKVIDNQKNNKEIKIYSEKDNYFVKTLSDEEFYKKMFDECYKQDRFEEYQYWINVGMALKNTFIDENKAFEIFNYYSSKGSKYEGYNQTKYKFGTFIKEQNNGYTVRTIYFYAMEDNKTKFIEIINKNKFELGETDLCKIIHKMNGKKFIYKKDGTQYKLFCFNGKYWENDDIFIRKFISGELYQFLKMMLVEVYWYSKDFNKLKTKIERLKTISMKKELIETYKEVGSNEEIEFDNKWWLFGFNNKVYDMKEKQFREYRYDDYVSLTTGYNWREPTIEEINTVKKLIKSVMPIKEERDTYLQLVSTAIDGRCLEKFIVFNGSGGNGKGLMNDLLLLALGNYSLIGNNAILFETNKTGSNPEKANIHKKRLVIFREPSEKKKFENSVIKELTGGGKFSARTHQEKTTEKELNLTLIVECNKKPLFTEEPKDSEVRRIIDVLFRCRFTDKDDEIDEEKYVFKANSKFKQKDFQEKHKFALLKILFDEHAKYLDNKSEIKLPQSIVDRTNLYLELSCNIIIWFKEKYEEDDKEFVKVKDIHDEFIDSEYYYNLNKADKRKYNKAYFVDYFKTNIFFRKHFSDRYQNIRNVVRGWKLKVEEI